MCGGLSCSRVKHIVIWEQSCQFSLLKVAYYLLSFHLAMKDETSGKDNWNAGTLRLSLMFAPGEKGKGTLHINIKQAKELPKMDPNGLTDGLVKCHLLPDKSAKGKRKTNVVKNNLNPVWEERFTYEKVTLEELSKERVLEVTVWDHDAKGTNDFIGGVRLGSAPGGTTSKHKEWMDSIGEEVSHWEAMLTHPGEWVDRSHTLRRTMEPRDIDLSIPPLQVSILQRQRQSSPSVERRTEHPSVERASRAPVVTDPQPPQPVSVTAPYQSLHIAQGRSSTPGEVSERGDEGSVGGVAVAWTGAVTGQSGGVEGGVAHPPRTTADVAAPLGREPSVEPAISVESVEDEAVEVRRWHRGEGWEGEDEAVEVRRWHRGEGWEGEDEAVEVRRWHRGEGWEGEDEAVEVRRWHRGEGWEGEDEAEVRRWHRGEGWEGEGGFESAVQKAQVNGYLFGSGEWSDLSWLWWGHLLFYKSQQFSPPPPHSVLVSGTNCSCCQGNVKTLW